MLPTFSKVYERVVFNRLFNYLHCFNLLSRFQFGFQKGRSTTDAILEFVDQVSASLDGSQTTIGTFCDLSKAFDCVNHEILIRKLQVYGIDGIALNWLISYLSNRYQKVEIQNSIQSSFCKITSGVPQGSILGPLLFLIYANDLPDSISNSRVVMYADDTSMVLSHKTKDVLSDHLLIQLCEIDEWFKANGLKLNSDKTQFMNFHLNHIRTTKLDSSFLPAENSFVTTTRFLGLELDSALTWNAHINILLPKLSKAIYALLALGHCVDRNILRQVYFAYFHSLLNYGLIFWGNSSDSSRVFILQKRAVRLISGAQSRDSCKTLFQIQNILPLPSLFIFQSVLYVKSNPERFTQDNNIHNHFTRNQNILQYPIHRTSFFERSPVYSCKVIFNHLPMALKEERSLSKFKFSLFKFLLSQCFYSVKDYLAFPTSRIPE